MVSLYYSRNFSSGYFYHIYNRGAFKKNIFLDKQDYDTFTNIFSYYLKFPSNKPFSEFELTSSKEVPYLLKTSFQMCAFCLMPNHFHFLIKQISKPINDTSIMNFMKRITITYSMYHKRKYVRSGALFESKYKNKLVSNDSQLLHLSRYIHLNPNTLSQDSVPPHLYPYSSYKHYLNLVPSPRWLNTNHIMTHFSSNSNKYRSFIDEKPFNHGLTEKIIIE